MWLLGVWKREGRVGHFRLLVVGGSFMNFKVGRRKLRGGRWAVWRRYHSNNMRREVNPCKGAGRCRGLSVLVTAKILHFLYKSKFARYGVFVHDWTSWRIVSRVSTKKRFTKRIDPLSNFCHRLSSTGLTPAVDVEAPAPPGLLGFEIPSDHSETSSVPWHQVEGNFGCVGHLDRVDCTERDS